MNGKLVLADNTSFTGVSFGAPKSIAGEVVFTTGMVGYSESLTDPSYRGQILVFTYPLIGNYGVPPSNTWESSRIQASGVIIANPCPTPSPHPSTLTLDQWLKQQHVPGLALSDTRALTLKLRQQGAQLGKIVITTDIPLTDPNTTNLVAEVSITQPHTYGQGKTHIVIIDCGVKQNIVRLFLSHGCKVTVVPWNYNPFNENINFDGLVISNGPGDPTMATATIATAKTALKSKVPLLGICLGNQILALAAGGTTYKLKFGHRGQNQPCLLVGSKRCYVTTQNHGFAVGKIPAGFAPWFINNNDGTNEGIRHKTLPFMSVQFHPEAAPGPTDTTWIIDHFLKHI